MEVAIAEEKKKIFRARKTMKFSDRQQLDSLHATLLTGSSPPSSANVSPPPLVNGVHHKEDVGQRAGPDKEHRSNNSNSSSSSNAVARATPSPASSRGSPDISLSLALSPSPPAVVVPAATSAEDALPLPASPASPFHSLNFELKKMEEKEEEKKKEEEEEEEEEKKRKEPPPASKDCPALNGDGGGKEEAAPVVTKAENKGEALHATAEEAPLNSPEEERRPVAAHSEPMETDSGPEEGKPSVASAAQGNAEEKPSSSPRSSSSLPKEQEVKEEWEGEEAVKEGQGVEGGDGAKKGSPKVEKMEVDHVKVEKLKIIKTEVGMSGKTSRPSSTPPSDAAVKEKSSTSGVKRALSEGDEEGTPKDKRGKKPKVDGLELEAQLELKITAKGGSRIKLEKVVQQLVEEQLRALQLSVMDKSLQELKEKVDAIDCDTKHQTALKTLQAKIVRLVKKFGTANQVSENKRKQEALAAAAAASAAATAAKNVAAAAVTSQQRLVRTSFEVKQTPTTLSPTVTTATASAPAPPTSSAVVTQAPILQIITSSSSPSTTLAQAISTQSPTGTLLFKTTSGGSVMTPGQPLLIQLPLSMTNGQTGTLVKFPVTSFASSGLGKAKTTAPTATFILKTAPAITTTAATLTGPVTATVPALQASGGATAGIGGQMSPAQLSLARAVYQGGVSATAMARAPAQLVSVAGAMMTTTMSASSSLSAVATSLPANSSGPAATGSAAPGPPQGTSLTSKTDNPSTTPAKTPTAPRPKGSVIDLTEDDDDVLVTSVKKATVTPSSTTQRSMVAVPTSSGVKSTPIISSNPQLTVHHRPPMDSPLKSRPGAPTSSAAASTSSTPSSSSSSTRTSAITLPALPAAPAVRLPPEAGQTSAPQQPQLKLVPSPTGIVLSWCVAETDRSCAAVDSYHLYAFHQDNNNSATTSQHWKKIGEVKALPLPMACTLTQFQSGSTYHFAVRAKDVYGRYGPFCEPQCTNVITSSAS